MSDASARFALPWLEPGQAQKEAFHNEALAILDAALHPTIEMAGAVSPPAAPSPGQCWALGAEPTGDWAGQGHRIAAWTEGGWRFVGPVAGMTLWSMTDGVFVRWTGNDWAIGRLPVTTIEVNGEQVLGSRQPAVADPAGGSMVDAQARLAVSQILDVLRAHGLISG
ncbi:DUF2793 domain-containing protein [Sphingomonas quercus]|uniref:DUF2793 domain-containing protein n=1 Tax=Sphingomonas quercus TaxID=2842451 RepID=A0ABS6BMN1_9SPHN|nr:DUF2793 domain-containing protein [Sphingomonas quercus]MBU3078460.1 DUF2793 domain-containing protein [Sphingomonas quercus]